MLKIYFKIAWRNLMKSKIFSLINVLGLTIGITCCMMIYLFIVNEFSYDGFHVQGKNIYRIMRSYDPTKPAAPYLSGPYADALLNDYPREIKKAVRIMADNDLMTYGTTSFNEKKVYLADADILTMFSFPLVKGNPATALKDPNSVVLTETVAKKYFGSADPMGKILVMNQKMQLKITGVAKDVPSNSHLDFDFIVPLSNYYKAPWFNVWINNNFYTYVLLNDGVDKSKLESTFAHFMDKYMGKDMAKFGMHFTLAMTPLRDVYFEPHGSFDSVKHGDKKVVYIFLSIAILILVIACINFMNLSTLRAVERSKEVGLRKVMGALRTNLVWQFIGESVLLTVISCILSIGMLQLFMPLYNQLLGHSITIPWNDWPLYAFLVGSIVLVGFLAGSYPALILSSFSPIEALKGKLKMGKGGSWFRQVLVVLQFSISVMLIVGTIVIVKQMSYVQNKNLGYDKEQSIVFPMDNGDIFKNYSSFRNELMASGKVVSIAAMSGEPGGFLTTILLKQKGSKAYINLKQNLPILSM